jgi:hypothetical protein
VEKTFRVLRTPASSQTQSVNVPPVSTATRISEFEARGMNREDYHRSACCQFSVKRLNPIREQGTGIENRLPVPETLPALRSRCRILKG